MSAPRRLAGLALAALLAALLASCAQKSEPRRELTERERDSTLGKSAIPGAAAVTRTLEVSDSAAARAGRMDQGASGQ